MLNRIEHTEDNPSQTLQQSRQELTNIKFALDQSSIVAITNHQRTITYVNDKFCEIFQYARAEVLE